MDVHLGCPWKSQLCLLLAMSMEVHLGCSWKCDLGDLWNMHMYLRCNVVCSWSCPWQVQLSLTMSHLIFTFHIGIAFDHAHGSFQVLLIAPRYMVATVVAALPLRGAVR